MMNPSLQGHNKRHLRHVGAFFSGLQWSEEAFGPPAKS